MTDLAARTPPVGAPRWRGPLIAVGILGLAFVLLAFTGLMPLLFVPVLVAAWSALNLKTTKWYWLPLAPCLLAVAWWIYLFVAVLLGYLVG